MSYSAAVAITEIGVVARLTDNSNFLAAVIDLGPTVKVYKVVAGTVTQIGSGDVPFAWGPGVTSRIEVTAFGTGNWEVTAGGYRVTGGSDSALATGGVLASGKSGIVDHSANSVVPCTRTYRNFSVVIPPPEPVVCYAGRSMEFNQNGALREIEAGGVYGSPGIVSQPFAPELTPAGAEGLTNRLLILTSRNSPDRGPDTLSDAFTVQVFYEPTWAFARSTQ